MSVSTLRFKFFKKDELKYLSHLDVLALMERALIRTGMPLSYSGGFHPKPKLSFSNPIPLGVQSIAEYCDVELLEKISAEDFTTLLNLRLPDDLKIIEALSFEKTPENKIPSLMSAIDIVLYEYELLFGEISLDSFLKDFGNLFGPTGEHVKCESDLQKIKSSIHYYKAVTAQNIITCEPAAATQTGTGAGNPAAEIQIAHEPQENIFFLKIYGYAKILKNGSNTIFKFNAFNGYFEKFLESEDIEVRQVQKTGSYILKGNVLMDPIGIIPF
jgi:radical SAM-linked protein